MKLHLLNAELSDYSKGLLAVEVAIHGQDTSEDRHVQGHECADCLFRKPSAFGRPH
jgi:hypothetical protein